MITLYFFDKNYVFLNHRTKEKCLKCRKDQEMVGEHMVQSNQDISPIFHSSRLFLEMMWKWEILCVYLLDSANNKANIT